MHQRCAAVHDGLQSSTSCDQVVPSSPTCCVAELLRCSCDEGSNGPQTLQDCLGVVPPPEQGRCIPQLQGPALLLKVCTDRQQTSHMPCYQAVDPSLMPSAGGTRATRPFTELFCGGTPRSETCCMW